jgi:hypothetical protein
MEITTASGSATFQINQNPETPTQRENVLRKLLDVCYHDADEAGFEGTREDWEPVEANLDFVVDNAPFEPTSEDWAAAGLSWVGGAHCPGDDA